MSTLNESMQDFIGFMKEHSSLDDFTAQAMTEEAHDDIQGDLASELADELMSIIGYNEDRPNLEGQIKDWIYDFYNLEKR